MKTRSLIARLGLGFAPIGFAALTVLSSCKTYAFDDVPVGHDEAARTPKAKSNSQFVRSVYADLVGRTPESFDFVVTDDQGNETSRFPVDEQSTLIDVLDGLGDPDPMRAVLVAGLVDSAEVDLPEKSDTDAASFVTDAFHRFLGRDPTTYELGAFVAAWAEDPEVTPRTVVRSIIGSREYQSN